MTADAFKDHFSESSDAYASFRPRYPAELPRFLASVAPATRCVLECGCGSGQLSGMLADHFDQVVATDASAEQIRYASPHANVSYRCAPAERSGMSDGTVDLVVAAQAAHWFDLNAFYAEAHRVAREAAAIVLVSYGIMVVDAETDPVIEHFYRSVVGPYWPPERKHVEDGYANLPFPFPALEAPEIAMEVDWSLKQFLGYIGTWSSVRRLRNATGEDPMPTFAHDLGAVWGADDAVRQVRWPLTIKAGRIS